MAIYALKPAFRRVLRPVHRAMERLHPDAISGLAVLCAAAAAVSLWQAPDHAWLYLLAPVLFFLRIAFNALDGMVAQSRGLASPRGEMVNEFSDRINDTLIFGGLWVSGVAPDLLVGGALVVTLLVSYLGILSRAAGGERRFDGPAGKADRMAIVGVACVVAFFGPRDQALSIACGLVIGLGIITLGVRWFRGRAGLGGAA